MGTIGIEWVNKYHGRAPDLKNCDNDADGFYNKLSGVQQFNYGDDLAWDQDFEESGVGSPTAGTDHIYVDNVDIVYFAGHSGTGGPLFGVANHDDGTAKSSEMSLGERQIEWIVFSSCELLKYDGGAVFNRWGWPVFNGLHYILGFHTTCGDSGSRGKKFAKKLNDGWTVRCAWIKACKETEGSGTKWAYLRADQSSANTNTYCDHWHGKGYVSPDPDNPSVLWYLKGSS